MRQAQAARYFDRDGFLSPAFLNDFHECQWHLAVACVVNASGLMDGGL